MDPDMRGRREQHQAVPYILGEGYSRVVTRRQGSIGIPGDFRFTQKGKTLYTLPDEVAGR